MNTDPRAVNVVNQFVRPGADRFVGTVFEAQSLLLLASEQNTSSIFPATSDVVAGNVDGQPDARSPVTNADVLLAMGAAKEFVTWASTPLAALGGKTPLQAFARLAVNPR